MKCALVWFMSLMVLLIAGMVQAGTVYYWTDENGVRHFSNTGAPEGVQDVGTEAESTASPVVEAETEQNAPNESEQNAANEQDQVIPNAQDPEGSGSSPTFRERFEQGQQERISQQAEEERRRLQAEIEQVEQRSLSRTFTEGMRAASLDPLRQQLALLNSDPDQYFRMKQEGAFARGGRTSSNRDAQN